MIPIEDKKNSAAAENAAAEEKTADARQQDDAVKQPAGAEPEAGEKSAGTPDEEAPAEAAEAPLPAAEENALLNDKYLRLCAEYDNYRKRTQKEKDGLYADIKANVVTSFLPVYDNLERALAQSTDDAAYAKGVEMIMNQFNATLQKLGVEEIPALGEKFDPSLHNAVMHVDDEEKGESEIVEVFQKGFRCSGKIIRFAMVKVAN